MEFYKTKKLNYLFILALVLYAIMHVYSWSNHPPDVDPINFTLALSHYDISTDSPHPPGYPLYVGLGRVAANFVGSQHAYQLFNLLMLLSAAMCLYIATLKKGYPQVGFACALLLLTHPLTLAATVIAETYFSDAFFGCLIAAWIITQNKNFRNLLVGIVVIFLALGLFRAVSCMELMLLAIACVYFTCTKNHLKNTIIAASFILFSTTIAYLITIWLAGGYQVYSTAVVRVMGGAVSQKSILAGAPVKEHLFMVARLYVWLLFVSLPTLVAVGYVIKKYPLKNLLNTESKKTLIICGCWILPPLGLFTFFYFLKPTYLLVLMPPIFLVFTLTVFFIFRTQSVARAWVCISLVTLLHLAFFYGGTKSLPDPIYRITHSYMKQQDAAWDELMNISQTESDKKALFVWINHPSLTFYAMRLLPWEGKFAYHEIYLDTKLNHAEILKVLKLKPLNPLYMIWARSDESLNEFIEVNKINKVLVLTAESGHAIYKTYSIEEFRAQPFGH